MVRTRVQAQGTPSHPQRYTGVKDAATRCYQMEGWRGFYKGRLHLMHSLKHLYLEADRDCLIHLTGLTPTLVKVVPAVAISCTL